MGSDKTAAAIAALGGVEKAQHMVERVCAGDRFRDAGRSSDAVRDLALAAIELDAEAEQMERERDACCDDYQKAAAEAERLRQENADLRAALDKRGHGCDKDGRCNRCGCRVIVGPGEDVVWSTDLARENADLRAKLEAAEKAHQFAEASTKVERGLAQSAEKRVAHLEEKLAAAEAEVAHLVKIRQWTHCESQVYKDISARIAALRSQQPKPAASAPAEGEGDAASENAANELTEHGLYDTAAFVRELARRAR